MSAESTWTDPNDDQRQIAWARETLAAIQAYWHGGLSLNFAGFREEKEALLRSAYGLNYDRLVELKRQNDPGNLFRMYLNIKQGV